MSGLLEKILASPWNPQRGREKVESMDRMRGSVVAPQPTMMQDALAAVYRGIRPSQENLGGLVAAIKPVYHGSPHAFDQFKLDKIGTGEGAQAYGHGLYFAEHPDVAKNYAPRDMQFEDSLMRQYKKAETLRDYDAMQVLEDFLMHKSPEEIVAESPAAKAAHRMGTKLYQQSKPSLYEASLRWPDAAREAADPLGPQHFLDWDKPLSQQSPRVAQALAGIRDSARKSFPAIAEGDPTGRGVYSAYQGHRGGDQAAASEAMRAAGIPGVRYLDGGSRGAGQGTHNYVAFDDSIIEVLKRNGVPLK